MMIRHSRSGSTMVAALIFLAIAIAAVAVSVASTRGIARLAQRTRLQEAAIAVGDAHLEWAFAQWRATCRQQPNINPPTESFSALTAPTVSLPEPAGYTISNYRIVAVDPELQAQGPSDPPSASHGRDPGETSYFYLASVDVQVPTPNGFPVKARIRRVFEKHLESPWKHAIFYNDLLEFHPSPIFTVNGWVHSNTSIYASPDGGNPLTFGDRVTFGDLFRQEYVNGDWQWRGRTGPAGAAPTFTDGLPPTQEVRKDPFGITPVQFDTTDDNPNNDGYRELIERPDSSGGMNDPLADGSGNNPRFYNNASVRVLIDANNTVTILNTSGDPVSATSQSQADRDLNDAIRSAITTNSSIQNNREGATVRLANLNIGLIKTNKIPAWNGVIYISDTSASQTGESPKRGIRLTNGATLPSGGLTVVSDNPVYIKGDYNTANNRQPAAVIGDAINILSNNWSDSNSSSDLNSGNRNASDTTVNTAILSGIVPTDPSYAPSKRAYSGGVENFPRFLENWSNHTFTYNGSMVELFSSKQATGRWGSDNTYNPPNRNWAFDTMFLTTPPPGTFFTTTYIKQTWYLE